MAKDFSNAANMSVSEYIDLLFSSVDCFNCLSIPRFKKGNSSKTSDYTERYQLAISSQNALAVTKACEGYIKFIKGLADLKRQLGGKFSEAIKQAPDLNDTWKIYISSLDKIDTDYDNLPDVLDIPEYEITDELQRNILKQRTANANRRLNNEFNSYGVIIACQKLFNLYVLGALDNDINKAKIKLAEALFLFTCATEYLGINTNTRSEINEIKENEDEDMPKYAIITTKSDLAIGKAKLNDYQSEQENNMVFANTFEEATKIFVEKFKTLYADSYNWLEDPICFIDDGDFETDDDTEAAIRNASDILDNMRNNGAFSTEGVADACAINDDWDEETWSVDIKDNTLLYKTHSYERSYNFVLHTNVLKMDDPNKEYFAIETDMFCDKEDSNDTNTYLSLRLVPIK